MPGIWHSERWFVGAPAPTLKLLILSVMCSRDTAGAGGFIMARRISFYPRLMSAYDFLSPNATLPSYEPASEMGDPAFAAAFGRSNVRAVQIPVASADGIVQMQERFHSSKVPTMVKWLSFRSMRMCFAFMMWGSVVLLDEDVFHLHDVE